jgi:hypothetical protein
MRCSRSGRWGAACSVVGGLESRIELQELLVTMDAQAVLGPDGVGARVWVKAMLITWTSAGFRHMRRSIDAALGRLRHRASSAKADDLGQLPQCYLTNPTPRRLPVAPRYTEQTTTLLQPFNNLRSRLDFPY